jgi:hypothetical protein
MKSKSKIGTMFAYDVRNMVGHVRIIVEFEVLAAVVMNVAIFCDIASVCELTFRRNIPPPSSGSKISIARNERAVSY